MKMVLNIAEIVSKLDPLTLPLTYVTDHHLEVLWFSVFTGFSVVTLRGGDRSRMLAVMSVGLILTRFRRYLTPSSGA
jgi:hypothetical protein